MSSKSKKIAENLIEANKTLEDIQETETPALYKDWWFERFFQYNLNFIFKEKQEAE